MTPLLLRLPSLAVCLLVPTLLAGGVRAEEAGFRIESAAFSEGGEIPVRFTCEGANVSPPLRWSDPPAGTKSFALAVADPDAPDPKAPRMTWVHWVLYAIPPGERALDEGAGSKKRPNGARSGRNDWGSSDYAGPCPPVGRHRYVHRIWALDLEPANWGAPNFATLFDKIRPHILGKAEITGTYEKQKK